MKTIWKFIDHGRGEERRVVMPSNAQVVHATAESEGRALVLTVWAVVDPTAEREERVFHLRGTGHPLGLVGEHVATTIHGPFVWHIFEAVYTTDHLEDS